MNGLSNSATCAEIRTRAETQVHEVFIARREVVAAAVKANIQLSGDELRGECTTDFRKRQNREQSVEIERKTNAGQQIANGQGSSQVEVAAARQTNHEAEIEASVEVIVAEAGSIDTIAITSPLASSVRAVLASRGRLNGSGDWCDNGDGSAGSRDTV